MINCKLKWGSWYGTCGLGRLGASWRAKNVNRLFHPCKPNIREMTHFLPWDNFQTFTWTWPDWTWHSRLKIEFKVTVRRKRSLERNLPKDCSAKEIRSCKKQGERTFFGCVAQPMPWSQQQVVKKKWKWGVPMDSRVIGVALIYFHLG